MSFIKNIVLMLVIIAIIGLVAYYFNVFGAKAIISGISPISSTAKVSQIINGSLGNIRGASNYSSQYKVAVNITRKYNEPIKHLVPFTGNSSSTSKETYNQEMFSTQGTTPISVEYDNVYIPIYINISDVYVNSSSYFSYLIGKTVYVQSVVVYEHNLTIQVPYTVQSEKIINSSVAGPMVYWHLTQATGISNNNAVNIDNNLTLVKESVTYPIGIYYNGKEILFPRG